MRAARHLGAYSWTGRLCRETLAWVPDDSHWAAMFTHQLGILAQRQGDYQEARQQYQRSLAIREALGNQAGMATSYGQLGSLLTKTGKVEEAVGYTLASLVFYLQAGAPEASLCLSWLARQQEQLGETQFRTVVRRHLEEEDTQTMLQLLKEQEGKQ